MIKHYTTYYLGAGASANALPIASKMKEDIFQFLNLLNPHHPSSDLFNPKYEKELFERYKYAISNLDAFSSIDSFAKSLDHRKDRARRRLLNELLSMYLIFKQFGSRRINSKYLENTNELISFGDKCFDNRYLSFLAKIYDEKLNSNVNVITWNYDNQMEIALSQMLGIDYYASKDQLNIYPNQAARNFIPTDKIFKLIKLNGSADLWVDIQSVYELKFQDDIDLDYLLGMALKKQLSGSSVAYAWDNLKFQNKALEIANQIMRKTESLIVIGYSFPDYNWDLDKIIFEGNKIEEVFIQIPSSDFVEIRNKMRNLVDRNISIQHYSNLNEFYLPIYVDEAERFINSNQNFVDN